MDSFEQQKDEIVKEWMQKNNVDLMEDKSQYNAKKSKKRTNDTFGSRKSSRSRTKKKKHLKAEKIMGNLSNFIIIDKEVIKEILIKQIRKLDESDENDM
jgi:hypothetical protein